MQLEITGEIYSQLYAKFRDRLYVYEAFSDANGDNPVGVGHPCLETIWGIKDRNAPFISTYQMKPMVSQVEWHTQYFLYVEDPIVE
ncbi:MAG: hypothetical protein EOP56_09195 [Sphingobacteriales bacterium]|nr:MAG: hypothetical protein EOP56_09195 [Sphingobacteriales bacterium]